MPAKVLVSSCLLGESVRYDASSNDCEHPFIHKLSSNNLLVGVCPEMMGGLPVPRPAAEIQSHKVINILQIDVTKEFLLGAKLTLSIAKSNMIKMAILKSNSPSCSNESVYDGSFNSILTKGMGVTAELLTKNGITVFNEHQLAEAQNFYLNGLHL